jgi:hypothetical protein
MINRKKNINLDLHSMIENHHKSSKHVRFHFN